jgi:hypothetical protein
MYSNGECCSFYSDILRRDKEDFPIGMGKKRFVDYGRNIFSHRIDDDGNIPIVEKKRLLFLM